MCCSVGRCHLESSPTHGPQYQQNTSVSPGLCQWHNSVASRRPKCFGFNNSQCPKRRVTGRNTMAYVMREVRLDDLFLMATSGCERYENVPSIPQQNQLSSQCNCWGSDRSWQIRTTAPQRARQCHFHSSWLGFSKKPECWQPKPHSMSMAYDPMTLRVPQCPEVKGISCILAGA